MMKTKYDIVYDRSMYYKVYAAFAIYCILVFYLVWVRLFDIRNISLFDLLTSLVNMFNQTSDAINSVS